MRHERDRAKPPCETTSATSRAGIPGRGDLDRRIRGSREGGGYRYQGARFYIWQPDRRDVVAWVRDLAPFDLET